MRSRHVVFAAPGRVEVRVEEVPAPAAGEIRCRAEVSLISTGTELACLRGVFEPGTNWAEWVRYPFRPGYCMSAIVTDVGDGVEGLAVGDRVASWAPHAEVFLLGAGDAYPVPDGVSAEAAAFTVLSSTAQLAVRRAELTLGERVGVIGLGLVGRLVARYCTIAGARTVLAIDVPGPRLDAAVAAGADALAGDVAGLRAAVAARTDGALLDAVFDATGHPDVLSSAIGLVRRLGRVVLVGDTPTPSAQHLGPGVVSNAVAILGIHATTRPDRGDDFHPWGAAEVAALHLDLVRQGRLEVADLITARRSPLDAPAIYESLRVDRGAGIGTVFDWSTPG